MRITTNLFLTPLSLLLVFSCSQEPLLTDLQFDDGIATYDGELYTGSAKSYYDSENITIKTISNYAEGTKTSYESFSENGDLKIKELFEDNNITQRTYYEGDNSFIIQKFISNELVETKINSLECDSTCTIIDLNLENLSLTNFTLRNVVFKDSTFKNVKFVSEDIENTEALAILDSVTFRDSKLIDVSFEDVLFLSDTTNYNFQKAMCIDRYGEDYPESSLQACIDDNRYSIYDEIDEFPLSLVLDNVTGGVIFQSVSLEENPGSLKILNSSLDNFAFTYFSKLPKKAVLFINDSNIKYVDELVIGSTKTNSGKASGPYAGKVYTTLRLEKNRISCDNSSIENGNLLNVLSMCEDFSENFDEFAWSDFEKTFIPDNSIYRISKYSFSGGGSTKGGYETYYTQNNATNQRYAIASGDKAWLLRYFKELLEHSFERRSSINEINPCDDSDLLYFTRYRNGVAEGCTQNGLSARTFTDWYYIPEESRTAQDENIMQLMVYKFAGDSKIDKLKETKFKSFDFSENGKKQAIQKYVDKHLNLDGMENCLRGKHVNVAREIFDDIYSINRTTVPGGYESQSRETRYLHLKQHEYARNSAEVQKFSECIENNISIYTPQIKTAYKPFSDLVAIAENELEIFRDEEKRRENELRRLRIAKRNALYQTFLESDLSDSCAAGIPLINAYFTGNAEAKERRIINAVKACQKCTFNVWATILSDSDFENVITGKDKNPESARSMGVADFKSLARCPVAGADRNVQIMWERYLN